MAERTRPRVSHFLERMWALSALRYVVVGGAAFAFDVGLLFLLHDIVRLPLPLSTAIAFLVSFAVTYVLQRVFTFRSRTGVTSSAVKYTLLVIANTFAVTAIVTAASAIGLPWLSAKVVAVIAMTIWNYFAYRYWVFAPGSSSSSGPSAGLRSSA